MLKLVDVEINRNMGCIEINGFEYILATVD